MNQKLENFLDRDLLLTNKFQNVRKNKCLIHESKHLKLFQNIIIEATNIISQPYSKQHKTVNKYVNRFSYHLQSLNTSRIFSNKKVFSACCKELALDSKDILSGKLAFSWAHPKNLRNVDKYQWVKTWQSGVIFAAPNMRKLSLTSRKKSQKLSNKTQNISKAFDSKVQ